jgi:esterase/lipase
MTNWCQICYVEEAPTYEGGEMTCDCADNYCVACLSSWIVTEIKSQMQIPEVVVRCPKNQVCKQSYSLETYVKLFDRIHSSSEVGREQLVATKEAFENFSDMAMSHYANNCEDIRKCANINCTYYGIIPTGSCADSLECP